MSATRSRWGTGALLAAGCAACGALAPCLQAQSWSTFQASRQVQAEAELRVDLEFHAGQFTLGLADPGQLYQMRLRYDEEHSRPVHRYREGRLEIGVEGAARRLRRGGEGELELRLPRDLPTDLRLEFGAVRAEMDLGGLSLRQLDVATGASDASVRVSSPNPIEMERVRFKVGAASLDAREMGRLNASEIEVEAGVGDVRLGLEGLRRSETEVKVSLGVGSVEVRVPEGVGVRLERSTFLTSVSARDLTRRGDAHYSPEWDTAGQRVRIHVGAALGSVSIVRVRPD